MGPESCTVPAVMTGCSNDTHAATVIVQMLQSGSWTTWWETHTPIEPDDVRRVLSMYVGPNGEGPGPACTAYVFTAAVGLVFVRKCYVVSWAQNMGPGLRACPSGRGDAVAGALQSLYNTCVLPGVRAALMRGHILRSDEHVDVDVGPVSVALLFKVLLDGGSQESDVRELVEVSAYECAYYLAVDLLRGTVDAALYGSPCMDSHTGRRARQAAYDARVECARSLADDPELGSLVHALRDWKAAAGESGLCDIVAAVLQRAPHKV